MNHENLRNLRLNLGMSQKDFAKTLGMTQQRYQQYECGKREPDHDSLIRLAESLNVSIDYLLGRIDDPTPSNAKKDTPAEVSEEDIMFALFDGDVENITDEMYEDVKRYAQFIKEKGRRDSNNK